MNNKIKSRTCPKGMTPRARQEPSYTRCVSALGRLTKPAPREEPTTVRGFLTSGCQLYGVDHRLIPKPRKRQPPVRRQFPQKFCSRKLKIPMFQRREESYATGSSLTLENRYLGTDSQCFHPCSSPSTWGPGFQSPRTARPLSAECAHVGPNRKYFFELRRKFETYFRPRTIEPPSPSPSRK